MFLSGGFTATGAGDDGAVRLAGAHIGGQLRATGRAWQRLRPRPDADGLQVGQDMFLRGGFTATGAGESGAVRLAGAHIGGQLDCDGASLRNDSGPALNANGLQVDQACSSAAGSPPPAPASGAVRLAGARIGGQLDCTGASLRNDSGPALHANSLQVGQAMLLPAGSPPPAAVRVWQST